MENMSLMDLRKRISTNSKGQKTLDLSHKQLTEFPEAVTRLHHIEVLNLSGNQLTELPLYIYRLRNLKELDVAFNNLTKIPESIGDLKKLTILKLNNNQLTGVPSSLTCLKNLQRLYLSRNSLRELPDSIGDLKSLLALNLDRNQLTTLPATIADLKNLERLELGYNNIRELPKDFGDLQSLIIPNIECSQLTVLPPSTTRLVNLEQLMLRDNELRERSEEIGDLSNLTILKAANNLMTVLPSSITRLRKLQRLELNGNKLEVLPKNLGELTNLTFLNVNCNPLTSESIKDVMDLRERKLETFARASGGGGNICFLYPSLSDTGDAKLRKELLQNFGRTLIFQDGLKEEGAVWELKEAAALITFPPRTVTEPQLITCSLWNPKTLSPPLDENEALVSNVIELSRDSVPSLELTGDFNKEVTLTASHSATDLAGYEVVIRQLIDQENNEWKDLETTNTWKLDIMSDSTQGATSSGAPAMLFPFAEAKLTQCSSFAVIWRLKSFTFSNKTTSATPAVSFTVPEYPGVSVAFNESALPQTIKIQEVPRNRLKGKGVLAGPVLHLSCSQGAEFLEPVTVTMPVSLRDDKKDIPDLSSCHVRVLYLNSEAASPEWKEITGELESPVEVKDGVVTFQVKHFSVFWTWFDWCRQPLATLLRQASDLYKSAMRQEAGFLACLGDTGSCPTFELALCCYPMHIQPRVKKDILASNIVRRRDTEMRYSQCVKEILHLFPF